MWAVHRLHMPSKVLYAHVISKACCAAVSANVSFDYLSSSSIYQIPNTEHMAYRLVRTLPYLAFYKTQHKRKEMQYTIK